MFLNLAWDVVSDLYLDIHNSKMDEWDKDGSVSDEFWVSAQMPLSNALVLTQQGIEFLLKSRIVEVSPYLLLANNPREWPANCREKDISFAHFRTVDAQDLTKIHDTVYPRRLDAAFSDQIEEIRRTRNTLMHTVDRNMRLIPTDIWKWILEASSTLIGEHVWLKTRRHYLEQKPLSVAYSSDWAAGILVWEALKLLNVLSPRQKRRYLGVDPKRRWYGCIRCSEDYQDGIDPRAWNVKTCQLKPREPGSATLYCFVCGEQFRVVRKKCPKEDCPGDVMHSTDGLCLTCMEAHSELG